MVDNSDAILKLTGVSAWYGEARALSEVDLEVRDGEMVALVGANSAGKTTMLRTIMGFQKHAEGSVMFMGEEMLGRRPEKITAIGMTMVPEGRRLFAGMTVEDNLRMGAYLRRDKEQIAADLNAMYELFPSLHKRRKQIAGQMSGGEQQMCALSRALMSKPRLLLVDELSLGLSPVAVDLIIDALAKINSQTGTSVLLVEQDASLALEVCQRAYVLETGKIVASGESSKIKNDPLLKESYLGVL